ncbi:hypothetical protein C8N32_107132 [Rhodovulum imhoffii]|uniref:Uncharacterized protein n=1 Tax=Rhodovulum imhoffii TaxID=365340 RepID=A0A2T5BSP6_9RHOB|nr:hypothetical protein [Rhodovulum imhoffii]MBK5933047.1 hypothetical protein [Rhodovulum imhoffii]PTN02365.1 hypothetical protein C8N32_107132 [Rhodovulum imhoffii]
MFLELIATFIAGIAAAGVALLLNMASGRRLPRWLMPVAAGAAMLGYTIWSEYSWAGRTVAALPDGVREIHRVRQKVLWKPWTYAAPQTTAVMAADLAGVAQNPAAPGVSLVDLYFFTRWMPARRVPQLVDCAAGARADVSDAGLSDPAAARWRGLRPDDPLLKAVCAPESRGAG